MVIRVFLHPPEFKLSHNINQADPIGNRARSQSEVSSFEGGLWLLGARVCIQTRTFGKSSCSSSSSRCNNKLRHPPPKKKASTTRENCETSPSHDSQDTVTRAKHQHVDTCARCSAFIGQNGCNVLSIRNDSGANLQVDKKNTNERGSCALSVEGNEAQIMNAQLRIEQFLRGRNKAKHSPPRAETVDFNPA